MRSHETCGMESNCSLIRTSKLRAQRDPYRASGRMGRGVASSSCILERSLPSVYSNSGLADQRVVVVAVGWEFVED